MNQQHGEKDIQLFSGGADTDHSASSIERNGIIDSQNMRPNSLGNKGDRSKIHGETILYPNIINICSSIKPASLTNGQPMSLTYKCIGSYQVLSHLVEFWASPISTDLPYVRVDGWIVLYPNLIADFPISILYPPQLHGNDSCVGGEVFYTDDNIPPFKLNVTDMLTNAGIVNGVQNCSGATPKYFGNFNISQVSIQPPASADHPQFIEIVPAASTPNSAGQVVTSGTGGMKVGSYQYGIQFVDSTGNTTNFSELTPLIPMPFLYDFNPVYEENIYPGQRVQGAPAGGVAPALGIHIRFRVNNPNNYSYVQVRRVSWNAESALNSSPNDDSVIYKISITNGQSSIIDFYDNDNSSISPVSEESETNNLTAIQSAKGIRYYNSRLTLWNVTYASRDIASQVVFNSGTLMYPNIRPLGVEGYNDIWNNVYRRTYIRGEKYGYSVVLFDANFNASFAVRIPGFTNYQTPYRRDTLSGASLQQSPEAGTNFGTTYLGNSDNTRAVSSSGSVTQTFEVFDTVGGIGKANYAGTPNYGTLNINQADMKNVSQGGTNAKFGGLDFDFQPFRPTNNQDTNASQYNYNPTSEVGDGTLTDNDIDSDIQNGGYGLSYNSMYIKQGGLQYNPKGFGYNLWGLGMIFNGIAEMPSWVSAFTVMRTQAANRIVAQGQSFYDFRKAVQNAEFFRYYSGKGLQSVVWDSPDFESGYVDTATVASGISANIYKLQVASPLGLFTEAWSGCSEYWDVPLVGSNHWVNQDTSNNTDTVIQGHGLFDMISYCRILRDQNNGITNDFNPTYSGGAGSNMTGVSYSGYQYTSWSQWRNTGTVPVTANMEIGIGSIDFTAGTFGGNPRSPVSLIGLNSAIYNFTECAGFDFNNSNVKNFHEPLYVANIVNDNQNVTTNNVQEYYQTGCWVKTQSIIGLAGGINTFTLVDERWQDCIPSLSPNYPNANQARFVYSKTPNSTEVAEAWLNVTYYTSAQKNTIITAINTNGYYLGALAQRCNGDQVPVYGTYTHRVIPYTFPNGATSAGENTYTINFDQVGVSGNLIPKSGNQIVVMYDNCAPVEVFGGDGFIGEYNYTVYDCQTNDNGNPLNNGNSYPFSNFNTDNNPLTAPMPYRVYQCNENTNVILTNQGGSNNRIQAFNTLRHSGDSNGNFIAASIRQYVCNGIIESRVNTALDFGNKFSEVNYIMSPYSWSGGDNLYGAYYTDVFPTFGYQNLSNYPTYRNNGFVYGGFIFDNGQGWNIDYSEVSNVSTQFSKPSAGFVEKLNFCTRATWSPQRGIAEQDSPNLLNFPSTNVYDFDDATGEFKRAWDSSVGGQQGNLYAFSENGIVMALTNKSIITEASGGQLAYVGGGDSLFIQSEVWLTRSIGMNDEMWRSAAEYDNRIWWANKNSIYSFSNNKIEDIGGEDFNYATTIKNTLSNIEPVYGTDVTAIWFEKYNEYILQVSNVKILVNTGIGLNGYIYSSPNTPLGSQIFQDSIVDYQFPHRLNMENVSSSTVTEFFIINNLNTSLEVIYSSTGNFELSPGITYRIYYTNGIWNVDNNFQNLTQELVWSESNPKKWNGQYKYLFDKYMSDVAGNIYGSRYGATFNIDEGYIMNGANVGAFVSQVINPKSAYQASKEFIRIRANSNVIPDRINFYSNIGNYNSGIARSFIDTSVPFALKNYGDGWEGYIGRDTNAPNYRNQGRYSIYQILYSEATEFNLSSVEVMYKILK